MAAAVISYYTHKCPEVIHHASVTCPLSVALWQRGIYSALPGTNVSHLETTAADVGQRVVLQPWPGAKNPGAHCCAHRHSEILHLLRDHKNQLEMAVGTHSTALTHIFGSEGISGLCRQVSAELELHSNC